MKMKQIIKIKETILSTALALSMAISFTACGSNTGDLTDLTIPDVLETTVGTVEDVYFSSNISDNPDYQSVYTAVYKDTTESDYISLMEHYESYSTGKDEDGFLLFDWGRLQVTTDDHSISITALIK